MSFRTNRRRFLRIAALPAASCLILADDRSARGYHANEKLNVALAGVGKRGSYHLGMVPRVGQNLVALCDSNRKQVARLSGAASDIPCYQDFRKMLDEMYREIDAVIVATPDHTHAGIAAAAMRRGKHVYVEKPIAHDVAEARALRRIAKEAGVATQMGNQGMATDAFRRTLELIREGTVGEIREVHAWYVFGGSGPRRRPQQEPPVPDGLDWDVWLGPAPFRPYHPSYIDSWWACAISARGCSAGAGRIRPTWRSWRSTSASSGTLTAGPRNRSASRPSLSEPCPENFPRWETLRFDFPRRGPLPPARLHWYNAPEPKLKELGIWDRLEKIAGRSLDWKEGWTPRSGTLLVGSKGVVHTNAHNSLCSLLPASDFPDSGGPPRSLPRSGSHEREWFAACRGEAIPFSNFDHSGPVIELMLLGNIATLFDQPLEFDPVAGTISGNDEADRKLRPERREGWSI